MDVSGNTSKASSVVAAICILVYIAAIAFGATRVIIDMGERRNQAEREFSDLSDRASSSAVFLGFMSEAYQETIRDFLNASSVLMGIIITSTGGEFAFERQPGSGIVWAGNSPRFRVGPGIPSEAFNMPLRIEGQRNVRIQANYSYIDYDLFQRVLRNTLMVVLGALLVAFVTLLVEMSGKRKAGRSRAGTSNWKARPVVQEEDSMFAEVESEVLNEETTEENTKEGSPQGLYSPRGNVGWESYTQDRLASELHRCSSFEQDLTFLVMSFRGSLPVYRQFTDEAVSFFYMRDLIFEQGKDGISVILPNMGLEQGMSKSEEFRSRIIAKLPESFKGRADLCIGLTSRAGRLVDAKRLMLEAFSALEKALVDDVSRVVAFKSDPEKYREFIRQSSRNS